MVSDTTEKTMQIGETVAHKLTVPSVVSLEGGLGSGKTVLTKGIARGLGIEEEITSPSYTIISQYEGKVLLYHIDLYRIEGREELALLGLEECLYDQGVSVVEWGEKAEELFDDSVIRIHIYVQENEKRVLEIEGLEL